MRPDMAKKLTSIKAHADRIIQIPHHEPIVDEIPGLIDEVERLIGLIKHGTPLAAMVPMPGCKMQPCSTCDEIIKLWNKDLK